MEKRKQTTDPAARALFANLFTSIAEEMGATLMRTAYSPNIKERRDFSCALFDSRARLLAQAAHIPVHLGAMPASVAAVLARFPRLGPGDLAIVNGPFHGGTHLPDITMVSPVFAQANPVAQTKPIGYLATRAHHADVGGMSPGSLPVAREIIQEGLYIPPVLLRLAGELNTDILDIILCNTRTPAERRGDLHAQMAVHAVGERRWTEALERHTAPVLRRAAGDLIVYGRELMQAAIRAIPDGSYTFADFMDDDGEGGRDLPVRLRLTIRGDRATLDFAGTAPQRPCSINAVAAITHSAVYYCFICLMVSGVGFPGEVADFQPPINAGCFEPIELSIPARSLLNAESPVAVVGGNVETSQRIVDVVFGALAKALPKVIPAASQGTMNNIALGGTDPRTGEPWAYFETIAGGMGARPAAPGLSGVQAHMTNTLNTPVEALEFACPLRVLRTELRSGSGGHGLHSGGDGIRRDLEALAEIHGSLITERRARGPWGLAGGGEAKPGRNARVHAGKKQTLPAKTQFKLEPGDHIVIETPGGGGWGKPSRKKRG